MIDKKFGIFMPNDKGFSIGNCKTQEIMNNFFITSPFCTYNIINFH